jgi:hypothetical protein
LALQQKKAKVLTPITISNRRTPRFLHPAQQTSLCHSDQMRRRLNEGEQSAPVRVEATRACFATVSAQAQALLLEMQRNLVCPVACRPSSSGMPPLASLPSSDTPTH